MSPTCTICYHMNMLPPCTHVSMHTIHAPHPCTHTSLLFPVKESLHPFPLRSNLVPSRPEPHQEPRRRRWLPLAGLIRNRVHSPHPTPIILWNFLGSSFVDSQSHRSVVLEGPLPDQVSACKDEKTKPQEGTPTCPQLPKGPLPRPEASAHSPCGNHWASPQQAHGEILWLDHQSN